MSFLAPLFLLGGLAVSLPILFHLIRRTPKGRQTFSSLMFLSPSPPRITRRSRIDHWLLLVLRALAITLLVFAFARPFVRASSSLLFDRGQGRNVAIVLDTSASMRRENLWSEALRRLDEVIDKLDGADQAALYRFDSTAELIVDFPDAALDSTAHHALLRRRARELQPTWNSTRLDHALTAAAENLATLAREQGTDASAQIVLISDMQQGADLSGLQGYEWPREVSLELVSVQPRKKGNASLRLLQNTAESDVRARISNSEDSSIEEFQIGWSDAAGKLLSSQTAYVPAGETRVVKLQERPAAADRLMLQGDSHGFDNEFYASPDVQRLDRVVYLGDAKADDPRGLRYFLERVWSETPLRKVTIQDVSAGQPLTIIPGQHPHLIVADKFADDQVEPLKKFLEAGGVVLFVASNSDDAQQLTKLLPNVKTVGEPVKGKQPTDGNSGGSFSLLSDIDFSHPIFTAFADPRFGDFTKVRFWRHQAFELAPDAKAHVVAKFDDGTPALWEQPVGKGRGMVFASSWRPDDSQLALTSKFVPLMSSVLNQASGADRDESAVLVVGDSIPLGQLHGQASPVAIIPPGGNEVTVDASVTEFQDTERPGTYVIKGANASQSVAVNLSASESDTAPLDPSHFEQLGVRIGDLPDAEDLANRERQMRDMELESRQKLWQWLIVAALVVLGIETALAGWTVRKQQREMALEASHVA